MNRDRSLIPDYFLTMLNLMRSMHHPVKTCNYSLHTIIQIELPKCNPNQ